MFTQSIESGLPASLCVPTQHRVLLTRLSIVLSRETKDRIDQSQANTISSPSLIILHQPSAHCEPGIPPASCCLGSTWHVIDLHDQRRGTPLAIVFYNSWVKWTITFTILYAYVYDMDKHLVLRWILYCKFIQICHHYNFI